MSNAQRVLSHRSLLPLDNRHSSAFHTSRSASRHASHAQLAIDKISPELVIQYLLNNPQFVESFLMEYYSPISLKEILSKMVNEPSELVYVPKRSGLFSQIKIKPESVSPGHIAKPHLNQCGQGISKDSMDSMMFSSSLQDIQFFTHCQTPFQSQTLQSQTLPNQTLQSKTILPKDEVSDKEDNVSQSDETKKDQKNTVSENFPKLSERYVVSRLHSSESLMDMDIKIRSSKLLSEMTDDLISILCCDGANFYSIDHINKFIYINGLEKISTQKIEKGTTLAAYVAHEKVQVNCVDIFMDDRFPLGILMNNSFIKAVIAQPIILNTGLLIGVLEVYRFAEKLPFSAKDGEVLRNYCSWASLSLYYTEIGLENLRQQKLNQFILKVTQKMFKKFKNIDLIIKEIMASAKGLVKADRVSFFLLDKDSNELYAKIFDNGTFQECLFETRDIIRFKVGEGIAGLVAKSGITLNIRDAYGDTRFNRSIDSMTGYITRTILCMPVSVHKEIIGVVQMLNKQDGVFTECDEKDFETFATYCGLALHISKMYEKIVRSQQKYKVALDVLSYHNGYSPDEFEKLQSAEMPKKIPDLDLLSFWPWIVQAHNQPLYVVYMFQDLFGLEVFDEATLMRFVLTVKKNYRIVPYHNWNHAFSVAHAMYALLKTSKYPFSFYESLAMFIGCLCHDLDHRGKTNQFMIKNSAPLSALYSTSTMEHHHFNMTITILQRDGHNIFSHLSPNHYKLVLGHIKHCILATDLAKYVEYRQILESTPDYTNHQIYSNRLLHMAISMTFSDLCSMFKAWDMQLTLVLIIMKEFWNQGDEEKLSGHLPLRMMDRDHQLELAECQVGFLSYIGIPCYKLVSEIMPEVHPVVIEAEKNLEKWSYLAKLPESEKAGKLRELEIYVEEVIKKHSLCVR